LNIGDKKFITAVGCTKIYGLDGIVELNRKVPFFVSSSNGQRIIYEDNGKLFLQNICQIKVDELFREGCETEFLWCEILPLCWIPNSNCILIDRNTIMSLNNQRMVCIQFNGQNSYLMPDGLVLKLWFRMVTIFVPSTNEVKMIQVDVDFITYNTDLDVLVTDKLQCYQIQIHDNIYKIVLADRPIIQLF